MAASHPHVERLEGGASGGERRERCAGDARQLAQRQAAHPRRRGQARQPGVRHRRRLRQGDRLQLVAHVDGHLQQGKARDPVRRTRDACQAGGKPVSGASSSYMGRTDGPRTGDWVTGGIGMPARSCAGTTDAPLRRSRHKSWRPFHDV